MAFFCLALATRLLWASLRLRSISACEYFTFFTLVASDDGAELLVQGLMEFFVVFVDPWLVASATKSIKEK